jgi:hypothetical protein
MRRIRLLTAALAAVLTAGAAVAPASATASASTAAATSISSISSASTISTISSTTPAAPKTATVTAIPFDQCSADFFNGDRRLGPATLPVFGRVGLETIGYQRTGGLPDAAFLAEYYDPTANGGQGGWIYPPANGYLIGPNGQPIETTLTLFPNQDIDRFGSEYGSFLAPEYLPYAMRAIPPQNLDGDPAAACNYHDYRVLKPFAVDAGPIAAWFGQPGGGLQYQLDSALLPGAPSRLSVRWLVDNGYLERIV